jgi:hypothetical protein
LLVKTLHYQHAEYRDNDVPEIDLCFLVHDVFLLPQPTDQQTDGSKAGSFRMFQDSIQKKPAILSEMGSGEAKTRTDKDNHVP